MNEEVKTEEKIKKVVKKAKKSNAEIEKLTQELFLKGTFRSRRRCYSKSRTKQMHRR